MSPPMDLTGHRFGKLTAVEFTGKRDGTNRLWRCRCDCGAVAVVRAGALRSGHNKTCGGCEVRGQTHGHTSRGHRSPTYWSWFSMKQRVTNPKNIGAKYYFGRVDMDPRWQKFEAFLADMGTRPEGTSIDRIDNDRGYWADNCRWSTAAEQIHNRRGKWGKAA